LKKVNIDKKGEEDIKKVIIELTRKIDHKTLVIWASDCAEHVLHYFEERHPKDSRPRKAIEAGRTWIQEKISVGKVRLAAMAAHAAAREAEEDISRAVARAAGHAAATVHVASHAIHAANYAAIHIATERIWQYEHLLNLMKNNK